MRTCGKLKVAKCAFMSHALKAAMKSSVTCSAARSLSASFIGVLLPSRSSHAPSGILGSLRENGVSEREQLFDLSGKIALVTGGSRGLGREMVLAFARAGADVVIASRKLDACEATAKEVERETGRRAVPLAARVGKWGEVESLAERAYAAVGRIDVLVNNAGMSLLYDKVANVTEAMWDKVVDLNLKGPFRLMALVGTRMAEGAGGS